MRFGIREITSEMTPKGATLFRVNGKRILDSRRRLGARHVLPSGAGAAAAQLRYVLDMHLNTIRLEGNYEDDRFFQRTDSLGLLVMTGWVCCDAFEEWSKWEAGAALRSRAASLRDQIRRLRAHPSVLVWLNGSDSPPPADVEQAYLDDRATRRTGRIPRSPRQARSRRRSPARAA